MFAVIYSGKVKPERVEDYKKLWHLITDHFIKHCGALGSCLHQTLDGKWIAYSRWPNRETRDAVWGNGSSELLPELIKQAIADFSDCISERDPEICLDVVDDMLLN